MKEVDSIEKALERIEMLSRLYDDILKKDISTKEELEVAKASAKVAKEEMLHLIYQVHNKLEKAGAP